MSSLVKWVSVVRGQTWTKMVLEGSADQAYCVTLCNFDFTSNLYPHLKKCMLHTEPCLIGAGRKENKFVEDFFLLLPSLNFCFGSLSWWLTFIFIASFLVLNEWLLCQDYLETKVTHFSEVHELLIKRDPFWIGQCFSCRCFKNSQSCKHWVDSAKYFYPKGAQRNCET